NTASSSSNRLSFRRPRVPDAASRNPCKVLGAVGVCITSACHPLLAAGDPLPPGPLIVQTRVRFSAFVPYHCTLTTVTSPSGKMPRTAAFVVSSSSALTDTSPSTAPTPDSPANQPGPSRPPA